MIGDQVEDMITEGVQKIIIFTDSQAGLNRIQQNEPGRGQIWASAIIRRTEEICRRTIQLEFRCVPGHAGIDANETVDQPAKDSAAPESEEELPSEEDWCIFLSHLRRCTTDGKWKHSDEWFEAKCNSK
jgi:ribonuclease HI